MAYIEVQVDLEDYLDEISTQALVNELNNRRRKSSGLSNATQADFCIPLESARTTLDDSSMIMRKMGRIDLAYKLDEIRVDFVEQSA